MKPTFPLQKKQLLKSFFPNIITLRDFRLEEKGYL
jgi:hypothetical protein